MSHAKMLLFSITCKNSTIDSTESKTRVHIEKLSFLFLSKGGCDDNIMQKQRYYDETYLNADVLNRPEKMMN